MTNKKSASSLNDLKEEVCKANIALQSHGLVTFTWGNVSGIDRHNKLVVIKPSGVAYEELTSGSMVVVDYQGRIVEGDLKPSSDTATHLALYAEYPELGGVVHTHSTYATAWAQACMEIPALGTTHADYFYGNVPCTRPLTADEIYDSYELNTGIVIIEKMKGHSPLSVPGVIVSEHGPFTWGTSSDNAVHNAVVLEEIAKMAFITFQINSKAGPISQQLMDKHYLRKHGPDSYYGQ